MADKKAPNLKSDDGRNRLASRAAPYYVTIAKNLSVGYKQPKNKEKGSWVAKYHIGNGKFVHTTLASKAQMELITDKSDIYNLACEYARTWMTNYLAENGDDRKASSIPGAITMAQAIDIYQSRRMAKNGEKSAQDAYQRLTKHFVTNGHLGGLPLSRLTRELIRERLSETGLADASKRRLLNDLKAMLNYIHDDDHLKPINFNKKVWAIDDYAGTDKARAVVLERDQIQILLKCGDKEINDLVTMGLLTGCRLGELISLKVMHLDLKRGKIHIPGGKTGHRDQTISAAAVEKLREIISGRESDLDAPVLRNDGEAWSAVSKAYSKRFRKMVKEANKKIQEHNFQYGIQKSIVPLPDETVFYTLRHTFITRAVEANAMTDSNLATEVGTSVTMIQKHYSKPSDQSRQNAMNSFNPI